jgi:YtkA-like
MRRSNSCIAKRCFAFSLLGCAIILCEAGCSRSVERSGDKSPEVIKELTIESEISPVSPHVGPAIITLRLTGATAKPVAGAAIALEADMSHAGMSPVFAEAKETEAGRYQAHLEFPMAGDWVILLHITLPGGKKLERQIDIRGVQPN